MYGKLHVCEQLIIFLERERDHSFYQILKDLMTLMVTNIGFKKLLI